MRIDRGSGHLGGRTVVVFALGESTPVHTPSSHPGQTPPLYTVLPLYHSPFYITPRLPAQVHALIHPLCEQTNTCENINFAKLAVIKYF